MCSSAASELITAPVVDDEIKKTTQETTADTKPDIDGFKFDKCLIVDDSKLNRKMMNNLISKYFKETAHVTID